MSDFNMANDLASQLVWGRYYQTNEPCHKPEKTLFYQGKDKQIVTATEQSHKEWAAVASRIEALLRQGYLPVWESLCALDPDAATRRVWEDERPFVDGDGEKGVHCGDCIEGLL
jgi:hypothetical protein